MLINRFIFATRKFQSMEYNRIVAVTGLPGLYEVLSSKTDGAIVRSLEDKSTRFISSRIHNLSHLESIEIYTVRENVSLADVFTAMKGNKTTIPDVKDNKALKGYFETVYPDIDFERVYTSDLKKMVKWYEVLDQNEVDFTAKSEPEQNAEEPVAEEVTAEAGEEEEKKTKAPAKAKAKPKAKAEPKAEAKKTKEAAPAEEEKPKKTTKKKKTGE
jgi:hypothetical protein